MSRIIVKAALLASLVWSLAGCSWIGYGKSHVRDAPAHDRTITSRYAQYAQLELIGQISRISTGTRFHHAVHYEIHVNDPLPSEIANVSNSTPVSAHADALAPYTITIEQDFVPTPQIGQQVCKPSGSLYFGYC